MKTIFKSLAFSLLPYLTGSFAQASFNITTWDVILRGFVSVVSLFIFIVSFIIMTENEQK